MLLHTWNPVMNRFSIRDVVVNIAIYVPLGMIAHLVLRGFWRPLLLGFSLSVAMEMIQAFDPTRDTSGLDVLTNVLGTAAGVMLGMLFERVASPKLRHLRFQPVDRGALMLLFLWVGWTLFPFFPAVGLYLPRQRLDLFLRAPVFVPETFLSFTAVWFAVGKMAEAAGFRRVRMWLACSILLVPIQFFVVDRQPLPSQLIGAAFGLLLFIFIEGAWWPAGIFPLTLVVRGLAPFHFVPQATAFSLVPFGGFLGDEWQRGTFVLLEKASFYGTAIWLVRQAGVRFIKATGLVAAILLAIELLQIHLPARTPEITDPLLAILVAFALANLSPVG